MDGGAEIGYNAPINTSGMTPRTQEAPNMDKEQIKNMMIARAS